MICLPTDQQIHQIRATALYPDLCSQCHWSCIVSAATTSHAALRSPLFLQGFKSVDVAVLWPKGYTQFHGAQPALFLLH